MGRMTLNGIRRKKSRRSLLPFPIFQGVDHEKPAPQASPAAVLAATLGAVGAHAARAVTVSSRTTPLMAPAERMEFQNKMWAAKTYDECKAIQAEHRTAITTRAQEEGVTLNVSCREACDQMRSGGFVN